MRETPKCLFCGGGISYPRGRCQSQFHDRFTPEERAAPTPSVSPETPTPDTTLCLAACRVPPSDRLWTCTLPPNHRCDHGAGTPGNVLGWDDTGYTINPVRIEVVRLSDGSVPAPSVSPPCRLCGWSHPRLSCREYSRRKRIVEFFAAYHHRALVERFVAEYDGPDDHDSIRNAFRPLLAASPVGAERESRAGATSGGEDQDSARVPLAGSTSLDRDASNSGQALRAAATTLLNRYVDLVNSGDAGHWNPEEEAEVIALRAALATEGT